VSSGFGDFSDQFSGFSKCKSFLKDEHYPEYKHARAINSRTDEFKCYVGPIFKLMEEEVYKHTSFIKHVPVEHRPKYIRDLLETPGGCYLATDFTAFEALFVPEIMKAVEFVLYEYLSQHLPQRAEFMAACNEVLAGLNVCEFKFFRVETLGKRMSGEMCTSLGNGFSNLMFMLFMCRLKGSTGVGVVEGDDGLFRVVGPVPTASDFERLGLKIKLEVHHRLSTASFCGIIFDPEDQINLTDAIEALAVLGWAPRRYLNAKKKKKEILLRCKALSLAHQYPGCPILQSAAWSILRSTRSVRHYVRPWVEKSGAQVMSMWDKEQYLAALRDEKRIKPKTIPISTRLLYEEIFQVTVEDQEKIEKYFDSVNCVSPICCPALDFYIPLTWREYTGRYVVPISAKPEIPSGTYPGFRREF
jgi:hypothetical protein